MALSIVDFSGLTASMCRCYHQSLFPADACTDSGTSLSCVKLLKFAGFSIANGSCLVVFPDIRSQFSTIYYVFVRILLHNKTPKFSQQIALLFFLLFLGNMVSSYCVLFYHSFWLQHLTNCSCVFNRFIIQRKMRILSRDITDFRDVIFWKTILT